MFTNITGPEYGLGDQCEVIIRALPEWFGIEQAIVDYVNVIDDLETFAAYSEKCMVGFISLKRYFQKCAELYVLAVLPQYQGRGVGTALLDKVESYCRSAGVEILQVKTLSPERANEAYEKTRQCYRAWGFRPFEELPEIWGKDNPCLVMIKTL